MLEPYYQHNGITIYHGDCREVLPEVGEVDLVLTDPPYGAGKADWDDSFPSWIIEEAFKKSESIAIMPGGRNIPLCTQLMGNRYKWTICGYITNGMTRSDIGFANWIPCILGGKIRHGGKDAFAFSIGTEPKYDHPSQKPEVFIRWLVTRLTKRGETVLDPFVGSGTTLVAAKDLDRKAIGIEIEEKYCEIAARRLQQEVFEFTS